MKTFKHLYNSEDLHIMKHAEDSLNIKLDRIDEIIEFAKSSGIKKIGIANCVAFTKETEVLKKILTEKNFHVESVNCKYGNVPFNDLLDGYKGTSCNPAGQAEYLNNQNTELNIMMGLCVGHDMIFNKKSHAPVTPLVVKDRKLKHQTLQRINDRDK